MWVKCLAWHRAHSVCSNAATQLLIRQEGAKGRWERPWLASLFKSHQKNTFGGLQNELFLISLVVCGREILPQISLFFLRNRKGKPNENQGRASNWAQHGVFRIQFVLGRGTSQAEGRSQERAGSCGTHRSLWFVTDELLTHHWLLATLRVITPLCCPITRLLLRELPYMGWGWRGILVKVKSSHKLPWGWPYKLGGGSHGNKPPATALTI